MDPSYAHKLLGYNKYTGTPDLCINPFDQLPPVAIAASSVWADLVPTGLMRPTRGLKGMSFHRAAMAAMDHDTVTAGLWALAAFDPALVHLAELREHFRTLDEGDPLRVTLDRLTSVYVEGQCRELIHAAGITTLEVTEIVANRLGDNTETVYHIVACTDHPLAIELFAYAQYLGSLTAHGDAPWKRFAAVMADCHSHLTPAS